MIIRSCIAFGVALSAVSAPAQSLPPTFHQPRERDEWGAWLAETRASGTVAMRFPQAWQTWQDRASQLHIEVWDAPVATRVIDELYVDYGEPHINFVNQRFLIGLIALKSQNRPADRLLPAAKEELLEGLRAYVAAGGGRADPSTQSQLAGALASLAPHDPQIQAQADELLADAIVWADSVGAELITQQVIADRARQQWGDAFEQRYVELVTGHPPAQDAFPKPYRRALEALLDVLEEPDPERLPARVRDAAEAVRVDCGDAALNADLLARLLLAWDLLLSRPDLPEKATDFIAQHLRRLAGNPRGLSSERHWELWARAVRALGYKRAPEAIRDQIRRTLRDPDTPQDRRSVLEQTLASIKP